MEEEENKLARLERPVENVDFDDQALHILGFHTGHRGLVQFSNGVSANTHKEFASEILMTMAHILDEGVPSLSFRLERAIRTRRPSRTRERGGRSPEGDQPPRRKHPQVEKKEDTVGRVTVINGTMSSTLKG
jgi:hypothetical protein